MKTPEPFAVKHYTEDARPTLKGNGFDGIPVGEDREDAERFAAWVNAVIAQRESLLEALRSIARYPMTDEGETLASMARYAVAEAEAATR